MRTDIKWICIFAALCALSAFLWFLHPDKGGTVAVIRRGGTVIKTVDLSRVAAPYELRIDAEDGGYNTVRIERGKIAVTDADCPDKTCVGQGYLQSGGAPIVCLPHRLSITIVGQKDVDAVSGGVG